MTVLSKPYVKPSLTIAAAIFLAYASRWMTRKGAEKKKTASVGVNAKFFQQLRWLLPICVPSTIRN